MGTSQNHPRIRGSSNIYHKRQFSISSWRWSSLLFRQSQAPGRLSRRRKRSNYGQAISPRGQRCASCSVQAVWRLFCKKSVRSRNFFKLGFWSKRWSLNVYFLKQFILLLGDLYFCRRFYDRFLAHKSLWRDLILFW